MGKDQEYPSHPCLGMMETIWSESDSHISNLSPTHSLSPVLSPTVHSNKSFNSGFNRHSPRLYSPIKDCQNSVVSGREYSPLRETPREYFECLEDTDCHDELFLLPEQVLDMDSDTVREDLSSIVPSFRRSPHNSLDSSDSGKSLKLMEDSDGLLLARASDDCKTFWLSETSNMNGVGDMPLSMSQSLSGVHNTAEADNMTNIMSQSMQVPGIDGDAGDIMTKSTSSLNLQAKQRGRSAQGNRNQTSQNWFMFEEADSSEGRADSAAKEKEREEKVRRMREFQEDEKNRKIEELKLHAQSAKKFREQQEIERRNRIESTRAKDMDRRLQVEERRRDLEKQEQERREHILSKNKERSSQVDSNRKNSRGNIDFAFGSSAPRMLEPRIDSSSSSYWGSRSTIGPGLFDRRSADREPSQEHDRKVKRTTSATGLDRSTEGDETGLVSGLSGAQGASAHRRRTDLVPTLVMSRAGQDTRDTMSRSNTPGLSRENSLAGSRPGSSLSAPRPNTAGVRLRDKTGGGRQRQRPLSIATTGMTASMYEERQRPSQSHVPRQKSASATPKADRMKRARSVTSETVVLDDDNRSTSSSQNVGPSNRTPTRKTPSQVKAEAAARKAKSTSGRVSTPGSTPKSSLGTRGTSGQASKTPSPALSQDPLDPVEDSSKVRQSTPDIIKDNTKKASTNNIAAAAANNAEENVREEKKEKSPSTEPAEVLNNDAEVKEKKIITSEEAKAEEAKAKIAKKRQEIKEQKERDAELERLRLEEEARLEEEQRLREEEEMRNMERMAEEARRAEEERIEKAIQEKDEADRKEREEEERLRKEKEETERKSREDAEKREVELQEKLRKEEEERNARKKRIEEIMARTRGKGAAKAEPTPPPPQPQPQEVEQSPPQSQPPSLDSHVDPVKPDLLGDISYSKVESVENAKNLLASKLSSDSSDNSSTTESISPINGKSSPTSTNGDLSPELEKGALDSISIKSAEQDLSSPLITIENGEGPVKKANGVIEGGAFDQILDLSAVPDSNKAEGDSEVPSPIIAFEENITSNNSTDLLS